MPVLSFSRSAGDVYLLDAADVVTVMVADQDLADGALLLSKHRRKQRRVLIDTLPRVQQRATGTTADEVCVRACVGVATNMWRLTTVCAHTQTIAARLPCRVNGEGFWPRMQITRGDRRCTAGSCSPDKRAETNEQQQQQQQQQL